MRSHPAWPILRLALLPLAYLPQTSYAATSTSQANPTSRCVVSHCWSVKRDLCAENDEFGADSAGSHPHDQKNSLGFMHEKPSARGPRVHADVSAVRSKSSRVKVQTVDIPQSNVAVHKESCLSHHSQDHVSPLCLSCARMSSHCVELSPATNVRSQDPSLQSQKTLVQGAFSVCGMPPFKAAPTHPSCSLF